jgi:UDP-glucose 4-epimerase
MRFLIPGGAGYIGSHMVKYAQEHDHEVVVLDDFSTGHEWAIKDDLSPSLVPSLR